MKNKMKIEYGSLGIVFGRWPWPWPYGLVILTGLYLGNGYGGGGHPFAVNGGYDSFLK